MTCYPRSLRALAFAFSAFAFLTLAVAVQANDEPPADNPHGAAAPSADESKDKSADETKKESAAVDADKPAGDSDDKDAAKSSKKEGEKKADGDKKDADSKDAKEKKDEEPKPKVTHHKATIAGQEISFTATAGKMVLKTDDGKDKANVFFVAYTKDDAKPGERPVTFCFNGGPGSSSVWLHLGMLGPTRVALDSDAKPLRPPHKLIPNQYSLLDKTDLVFIDPVSTGYSRPAKGEKPDQFHGYREDLNWVAQFIHDWTSKYGRWGSPKFLIGESYGGLRAAGLSGLLQDRYKMYLNGIAIISGVVDFQTIAADGHNDLAYAMFLPSYAATAWYHKALGEELQKLPMEKVVAQAERFAAGPYLRALAAGDSLKKERRQEVVKRMAELTGLSEKYVDAANLRVSMPQFGKELLRSRRRVVGRFDSRYLGIDHDQIGEYAEHDPSAAAVFGTFTSAMNDYLRSVLEVEETGVYEILTDRVFPWNYDDFTNRYVDAGETLRSAMTENPYLKVFAAVGFYDLATPEFGMKYTKRHLDLAPEVRDNFTIDFYEGGHMMYAQEASLAKLREDLLKFYDSALNAEVDAEK